MDIKIFYSNKKIEQCFMKLKQRLTSVAFQGLYQLKSLSHEGLGRAESSICFPEGHFHQQQFDQYIVLQNNVGEWELKYKVGEFSYFRCFIEKYFLQNQKVPTGSIQFDEVQHMNSVVKPSSHQQMKHFLQLPRFLLLFLS